ncbi:MAG: endonuclease domain-containing protein [Sphingomonas sp.]
MRLYDNQPSGTVQHARQLRRDAPEPERRLLRALRDAFPHLKWRYQAPLGPYRADILCFSERLVIEVDGDTHAATTEYDAIRTRSIERQGYRVIRFANTDVMTNLDGVLTQIPFSLREKEGAAHPRKAGGVARMKKGGTA